MAEIARETKRYPSDLTDEEWERIRPLLPKARPTRSLRGRIAMPDVIAALRAVGKAYDGGRPVVENLDLDIYRGEFLTLLGPSGSGKTTTLLMLAGFELPTTGEVWMEGRSMLDVPPYNRNIGIVFQNYALFPHMTVYENVAYPLRRRGQSRREIATAVTEILEKVKMIAFAGRYPGQLSGGQQQRVALARALIFKPDMVLMDEPLGALDKKLREEMQSEIRHLHTQLGTTILYVTHDQDEALAMSDRIAVFNHGAICQIGSPREIYDRPASLFVASFVGEINLLPGVVEWVSGDTAMIAIANGTAIPARKRGPLGVSDRAWASVRPENVLFTTCVDNATPPSSSLKGRLEEVVYFGDHARLLLQIDGGTRLSVKAPVRFMDGGRIGDTLAVHFADDGCIAFPQ
jgi:putative spermidine/putrescine transport system ATP-binding protein